MAELHLVVRIEHEEPPPAGADDFATERAIGHRAIVPRVDVVVAHAFRALLLSLPMHVHKPRELLQFTALECRLALFPEFLDEVKVVSHRRVGFPAFIVLLFQDRGRAPRVTGKEEQQVVFEIEQGLLRKL